MQQGEVFIKFYAGALDDGFIGFLGPELFQLYAALARYMDRNGFCYPSQTLLASKLNISRETINKRIKKLASLTWDGEYILRIHKRKDNNGRYSNNIYELNTSLAFRIFTEQPYESNHVKLHQHGTDAH